MYINLSSGSWGKYLILCSHDKIIIVQLTFFFYVSHLEYHITNVILLYKFEREPCVYEKRTFNDLNLSEACCIIEIIYWNFDILTNIKCTSYMYYNVYCFFFYIISMSTNKWHYKFILNLFQLSYSHYGFDFHTVFFIALN